MDQQHNKIRVLAVVCIPSDQLHFCYIRIFFMFVFYILAIAVIYCLEMYIIRVGLFCRNVFITNVNNTFMEELIYAFNIISWSV